MTKTLKEQFANLGNLLNKASEIAQQPSGVDFRLKWLTDRDFRKKLFEENPKCYLTIRTATGNDIPLIPTCNRMALSDPKVIGVALTTAQGLVGHQNVDQDRLSHVINRLMTVQSGFGYKG